MPKQKKSGSKKKKSGKKKTTAYQRYLKKFKGGSKAKYKAYAKKWNAKTGKAKPKKKKGKAKKSGKKKSHAKKKSGHKKSHAKKPHAKKKKHGKKGKRRKASTAHRHEKAMAKLRVQFEKARAAQKGKSQAERARLEKKIATLQTRYKEHESMAAEARRRKGKSRKRRRNPVTGWGEGASTVGGVVVGGLLLVVGDALIATRGNVSTDASGNITDQPPAGGVYVLEAQALPVWSQFKHAGAFRMIWALFNTAGPLFLASRKMLSSHKKTQAFLDGWGYGNIAIAAVKVSTDTLAMVLGKKALGFKIAPVQLAAKNAAAYSKAAPGALPAAQIVPSAVTGDLGYGASTSPPNLGAGAPGCEHVGAGDPCCENCAKRNKSTPRPGNGNQQPNCAATPGALPGGSTSTSGGTPGGPAGTVPRINANPNGGVMPSAPSGLPQSPLSATGAGSVTPIANRFQKSRFDRSKFGT